jgi:predicted secreted acid phosphatase
MKRIYTALILALAIGTSVNSMAYAAKSFDQEQQTVRAVHVKQTAAAAQVKLQAFTQAHSVMDELSSIARH